MKQIFLFLLFIYTGSVFGTEPRHICGTTEFPNVATAGDSRSEQLGNFVGTDFSNVIQTASTNGKQILAPNQIAIQNRGQYGSMASEWVNKIIKCGMTNRSNYQVPMYTIVSLGGNDVLNYIKQKNELKQVSSFTLFANATLGPAIFDRFKTYANGIFNAGKQLISSLRKVTLKGFLRSPFKTISSVTTSLRSFILSPYLNITGNPNLKYPDFATQWEWQDSVAMDRIETDMRYVLRHFLDQSNNHKVILNTVQITALNSYFVSATQTKNLDYGFYFQSVVKLFNNLHTRYRKSLYLNLKQEYGHRIVLVDTYYRFMNNILREGSSFYITDGIHFSNGRNEPIQGTNPIQYNHIEGGLEYWGKALAVALAANGWFASGLDPGTFANLYVDIDVQGAAAAIDSKSKMSGIDSNLAQEAQIDSHNHGFSKYIPQDPIIITYLEMDYEFDNDKSFYVRNGDNNAYMVRGDIRLMYEGSGGPDGALGFPIQDEFVGSIFESFRIQAFECGTITKNYFDLITPQKIEMNENSPTCLEKKARDSN